MTDDAPDPSPAELVAAPRRGRLLLAACTLLAIGIGANLHRYARLLGGEGLEVDESVMVESRYVAYMMQPAEEPELEAPDDEAGGQGQRHKGEEGRMGRPSAKAGRSALPAMARSFDPELAARNAGILGQMEQESGHFLASPYGGAFAVGNDDQTVWGGLGAAHAQGARPRLAAPGPARDPGSARLDSGFVAVADDPVSTFSIDVDTGSYSLLRRQLVDYGSLPEPDGVRVEELINYFDYDYPEPTGDVPVSITSEVGPCPWDDAHRLVRVGLQAKHVAPAEMPSRNLVFLVDVSGSMSDALPLVVSSLTDLTEQLGADDRIAIVTYAGASGTVLPPTRGSDKATILAALERLEAGGSTNGGQGIEHAYALARRHFVEGGINRVVLATDGDFNVGVVSHDALVELIEAKRKSGVFLSVLGFGGYNYQDHVMEQLADKGNGNYAYIDGEAEARKVLVEQLSGTLVTVAKDVKIQVTFDPTRVERYRLVGYTNRVLADRDFADDTKDAGDIGAGHTVTALYEIETTGVEGGNVMELDLRYKDPDGDESRLVEVPVSNDRVEGLSEASRDFRFAAAVAGFGRLLQGTPSKSEQGTMHALRDLAIEARGADPQCRRAELVQLIDRASALRDNPLPHHELWCSSVGSLPREHYRDRLAVEDEPVHVQASHPGPIVVATPAWQRFVLDVLGLLPPLLALPLFVMALRRPRRRS